MIKTVKFTCYKLMTKKDKINRKNGKEILKNINVNSRISIEERKDEYEKY